MQERDESAGRRKFGAGKGLLNNNMDRMDGIDLDDADQPNHDKQPGFFARNWGVIAFGTLVALGFVALVLSVIFPPVALVALIAVVASSPVFAWAGLAAVGLVTALSAAVVGVMSALMAKLVVSATNLGADVDVEEGFDADFELNEDQEMGEQHRSSTRTMNNTLLRRVNSGEDDEMFHVNTHARVQPSVRYTATQAQDDEDVSDEELNRQTPPMRKANPLHVSPVQVLSTKGLYTR